MVLIAASVDVEAPATEVWRRLTDWPEHGRWVPLTSVRVLTAQPEGVGARFVGRTALGRLGFDDVMEVTGWRPPSADDEGRVDVVRHGRVLVGSAWFEVRPRAERACTVTWGEDVELGPLSRWRVVARLVRLADPLVAACGRLGLRWVLRRMAADLRAAT
jgi:hypothetical protein